VTRFAQRALKPDDVMPEWNKAMKALGTEDDVENFVCAASRALSTPVEKTAKGLRLPVEHLPAALRERVENGGLPDYFDLHYPPQSGAIFVHRTHPAITAIADYLAEVALSQSDTSLIARCGAIFTNAVEMRTAIYLLRLRSQLALRKERSAEEKLMLAEEAVIIAISGGKILTDDALKPLLEAQPVRDMVDSLKARQIKWALDQIQEMNSSIEALAKARAEELLKDHRRVREAANARGSYGVKPVLRPILLVLLYWFRSYGRWGSKLKMARKESLVAESVRIEGVFFLVHCSMKSGREKRKKWKIPITISQRGCDSGMKSDALSAWHCHYGRISCQ
jgi:hypothetical protein